MDNLEFHAKKKERDHIAIKNSAMTLYRKGILDEKLLSHAIDKAFSLGHQAGFNRGQLYYQYEENKRGREIS